MNAPNKMAIGAMTALALAASISPAEENDTRLLKDAQGIFEPLPQEMATWKSPVTPERVELGRKLFFDPRISDDGTVSCARCHQPALYGTDGLAQSLGVHSKLNPRNSPTVLNAALQFKAHWRGDRENVEDQAHQALIGPPSFGNPDYAAAVARLKAIPGYSELFKKAFPGDPDPVTPDNWGQAIGAYERTLLTPCRFDLFLAGKTESLSAAERQGLRTFMDVGCADCHGGQEVGGGSFEKFGVVEDYWKQTGSHQIDKGRFDVTSNSVDMYVFKVPSLRNVAMTPPYFHDGSVNALSDAVRTMAKVQLGKDLSDQETSQIVAFLQSLTGELPEHFANAPVLPVASFGDRH
jgi:cytochrome c peroxidase